jgi:hypothetical protein
MIRIETKHLFNEGVSPHIKSLVLKRRIGIKLTEKEESKLKRFSESVNMVSPTSHSHKMGLQTPPKPIEEPKSFDELEDDEELDLEGLIEDFMFEMELQEILEEMGYEG